MFGSQIGWAMWRCPSRTCAALVAILACGSALLSPTAATAQNLDLGLVSYYRFDGSLEDLTSSNHDGVALLGAVPTYLSGPAVRC